MGARIKSGHDGVGSSGSVGGATGRRSGAGRHGAARPRGAICGAPAGIPGVVPERPNAPHASMLPHLVMLPRSCSPLVMPGLDPGTHAAYRRARRAVGRGGGAGGWPDQVRPWVPGSSPGMTGWGVAGVSVEQRGEGAGPGATGRRGRAARSAARPPAIPGVVPERPNAPHASMLPHLFMLPRSCSPLVMPGPRIESGGDPGTHCRHRASRPGTHAAYRRARRAVGRRGAGGWPDQVRPWVPGSSPGMTGGGAGESVEQRGEGAGAGHDGVVAVEEQGEPGAARVESRDRTAEEHART